MVPELRSAAPEAVDRPAPSTSARVQSFDELQAGCNYLGRATMLGEDLSTTFHWSSNCGILVTISGSGCHDRRCPVWRGCSTRSVTVKPSVCVTGCCTPWMRAISVASHFTVALRSRWLPHGVDVAEGDESWLASVVSSMQQELCRRVGCASRSERFTLASLVVQTQL